VSAAGIGVHGGIVHFSMAWLGVPLALYQKLPMNAATLAAIREVEQEQLAVQTKATRWWEERHASAKAALQVRELRLSEALASGFLEPDLYELTIRKIRTEATQTGGDGFESPASPASLLPIAPSGSLVEMHLASTEAQRRSIVVAVFERLLIDHTGVVDYTLRSADDARAA
jgi:hypothetical protein